MSFQASWMKRNIKPIATDCRLTLLKNIAICLIVGLAMGFIATQLGLDKVIGFSPYTITIPAAFAPFFTGTFKLKNK